MGKYVSKEDVVSQILIIDLAKEFNIELEKVTSGNFDYRCKCPSVNHKNGSERTSSCYIDSRKNNFYCYGCNLNNSCIDFYMACKNIDFGEAFSILKQRAIPTEKSSSNYKIEKNNFYTLLQTSKMLRKAMLEHPEDLKWINNLMQKLDELILSIEPENEALAKKIAKSLNKKLTERYCK